MNNSDILVVLVGGCLLVALCGSCGLSQGGVHTDADCLPQESAYLYNKAQEELPKLGSILGRDSYMTAEDWAEFKYTLDDIQYCVHPNTFRCSKEANICSTKAFDYLH